MAEETLTQPQTGVATETLDAPSGGGLLDQNLTEGRMARDEFQKESAKDMIAEFVSQVMDGQLVMSKNMDVAINNRIAEIDRLLTAQLNEILHQRYDRRVCLASHGWTIGHVQKHGCGH